jgi:hypothetical protein
MARVLARTLGPGLLPTYQLAAPDA